LKDVIGEWMFALCDNDGLMLSAQIGYGNAAGYLFNKGILSAPPSTSSTTTSTTAASTSNATSTSGGSPGGDNNNINPITGMVNREVEDDLPEMTDEEKEREAERLFVFV
jgi:Guanine nucleotide exchange factor synembryn